MKTYKKIILALAAITVSLGIPVAVAFGQGKFQHKQEITQPQLPQTQTESATQPKQEFVPFSVNSNFRNDEDRD